MELLCQLKEPWLERMCFVSFKKPLSPFPINRHHKANWSFVCCCSPTSHSVFHFSVHEFTKQVFSFHDTRHWSAILLESIWFESENEFRRSILEGCSFLVFENASVAVGHTAGSEGLMLKTRACPGEKSCLPAARRGHLQCMFKPTPIQTSIPSILHFFPGVVTKQYGYCEISFIQRFFEQNPRPGNQISVIFSCVYLCCNVGRWTQTLLFFATLYVVLDLLSEEKSW